METALPSVRGCAGSETTARPRHLTKPPTSVSSTPARSGWCGRRRAA